MNCRKMEVGGDVMKRDMEVVRKILVIIAESEKKNFDERINIPGVTRDEVEYHLEIMRDANILKGNLAYGDNRLIYHSLSLSWHGNDFYETFQSDGRWEGFKEWLSNKGLRISEVPFDMMIEAGEAYIKSKMGL